MNIFDSVVAFVCICECVWVCECLREVNGVCVESERLHTFDGTLRYCASDAKSVFFFVVFSECAECLENFIFFYTHVFARKINIYAYT